MKPISKILFSCIFCLMLFNESKTQAQDGLVYAHLLNTKLSSDRKSCSFDVYLRGAGLLYAPPKDNWTQLSMVMGFQVPPGITVQYQGSPQPSYCIISPGNSAATATIVAHPDGISNRFVMFATRIPDDSLTELPPVAFPDSTIKAFTAVINFNSPMPINYFTDYFDTTFKYSFKLVAAGYIVDSNSYYTNPNLVMGVVKKRLVDTYFGDVTYMTTTEYVLPIVLKDFTAVKSPSGEVVNLYWEVTEEINTKIYGIERSADGINYTILCTKDAAHSKNYSAIDARPLNGINYYRLYSVDIDGSKHYSGPVRTVIFRDNISIFTISPNPLFKGNRQLTLNMLQDSYTGVAQLIVTDMVGKKIQESAINVIKGTTVINTELKNISTAGTYFISVIDEQGHCIGNTQKLLVQ